MRFIKRPVTMLLVVAVAAAQQLAAQATTKVGLLPGLGEDANTWYSTYSYLTGSGLQLASIFRPGLPTSSVIQTQTSWLASNYSSDLGSNTILVAHSNGGLVARLRNQQQTLKGVATIGTPNYGVPLLTNGNELIDFFGAMLWDAVVTLDDFLVGDNYWLYDTYLAALYGAVSYAEYYAGNRYNQMIGYAVSAQDLVASGFLDDTLNASGNVTTELGNATTSIAVRVTAENYFDGGPVRWGTDASGAADFSAATYAMAVGALTAEEWILDNDYPLTDQNWRELDDLDVMATLLFDYEQVWCAGLTDPHPTDPWLLTCDDNDGLVGIARQTRPGVSGTNVVAWTSGPRHNNEPNEGILIANFLHNNFGVSF